MEPDDDKKARFVEKYKRKRADYLAEQYWEDHCRDDMNLFRNGKYCRFLDRYAAAEGADK